MKTDTLGIIARSCALALLAGTNAWAGASDADAVLACAAKNTPAKTFRQVAEFASRSADGLERELQVRLLGERADSGLKLNLLVTAPSSMAGTTILIKEKDGQDEMRIFLPATGRAQAVSGSMAASKLLGTDFSYLDIKQMFGAVLDGEAALIESAEIDGRSTHRLQIKPIPEEGAPFRLLRVSFDQETCVPLLVESLAADETVTRRLAADSASIKTEKDRHYAQQYTMHDLISQTETRVSFSEVAYDDKLHRTAFHPINFMKAD